MPIVSFNVLGFTDGSFALISAKHRLRRSSLTEEPSTFWALAASGARMRTARVMRTPWDRTDTLTSDMDAVRTARILRQTRLGQFEHTVCTTWERQQPWSVKGAQLCLTSMTHIGPACREHRCSRPWWR